MAVPSASADETRCPSMAVITDRGVMPADAAGDPGRTLSTNAPEVAFNPSRGAVSDSRSSVATPRNPGGPMTMLPVSFPDRICPKIPSASFEGMANPMLEADWPKLLRASHAAAHGDRTVQRGDRALCDARRTALSQGVADGHDLLAEDQVRGVGEPDGGEAGHALDLEQGHIVPEIDPDHARRLL